MLAKLRLAIYTLLVASFLTTVTNGQPLWCSDSIEACRRKISLAHPVVAMMGPEKVYEDINLNQAGKAYYFISATVESFSDTEIIGNRWGDGVMRTTYTLTNLKDLHYPFRPEQRLDLTKKITLSLNNGYLESDYDIYPGVKGLVMMRENDGFFLIPGEELYMFVSLEPIRNSDGAIERYDAQLMSGFGGVYQLDENGTLQSQDLQAQNDPLLEMEHPGNFEDLMGYLNYNGRRRVGPRGTTEQGPIAPKPCTPCYKTGTVWDTGIRGSGDPNRDPNEMVIYVTTEGSFNQTQGEAIISAVNEMNVTKWDGERIHSTGFYFMYVPPGTVQAHITIKTNGKNDNRELQVNRKTQGGSILLKEGSRRSFNDTVGYILHGLGLHMNLAPVKANESCQTIMALPNADGTRNPKDNFLNMYDIDRIREANSQDRNVRCTQVRRQETSQVGGGGGGETTVNPGDPQPPVSVGYGTCYAVVETITWYLCGVAIEGIAPTQPPEIFRKVLDVSDMPTVAQLFKIRQPRQPNQVKAVRNNGRAKINFAPPCTEIGSTERILDMWCS